MRLSASLSLCLCALGCANTSPAPTGAAANSARPAAAPQIPHARAPIDRPDLHGASGMARGPDGHLYTVLERDHRIFELVPDAESAQVRSSRAVIGAPGGVDLESIAFIDATHLVFGTETTKTDRAGDLLLFAEMNADKVVISPEPVLLEYAAWGITPERNRGIEGLCITDKTVVAAVETAGVQDGQRYAPVATLDLASKQWTHYRVGLTSETGKLAALTCRKSPSGIEVLAVERHYEVSRIVQFTLSADAAARDVRAEVVQDLAPIFGGDEKIPNFEGLSLDTNGRMMVISDNDYGGITGPTELLIIPPPTAASDDE